MSKTLRAKKRQKKANDDINAVDRSPQTTTMHTFFAKVPKHQSDDMPISYEFCSVESDFYESCFSEELENFKKDNLSIECDILETSEFSAMNDSIQHGDQSSSNRETDVL